jgi:hypothetical protein
MYATIGITCCDSAGEAESEVFKVNIVRFRAGLMI